MRKEATWKRGTKSGKAREGGEEDVDGMTDQEGKETCHMVVETPVLEATEVAPENLDPVLELVTFDPEAADTEEVATLTGLGLMSTNPACSEDVWVYPMGPAS